MEPLMTIDDVARVLHVSRRTVNEWRRADKGPAWVRIGTAVLYLPDDVRAFVEGLKGIPAPGDFVEARRANMRKAAAAAHVARQEARVVAMRGS